MKRTQREIVLPETKPETEWLRGRAVKKMSPERTHAVLQLWLARRLDEWAGERGIVGIEWRFRMAPPGEAIDRSSPTHPIWRTIASATRRKRSSKRR